MPSKKKPSRRKAAGKAAPKSPRRPSWPVSANYQDDDEEVVLSVHKFDCTLDPPNPILTRQSRAKLKDVKGYKLTIKVKGVINDQSADFKPEIDAIFLTRRAHDLWKKYVPPNPTLP